MSGWINVYPGSLSCIFDTRDEADLANDRLGGSRIACLYAKDIDYE